MKFNFLNQTQNSEGVCELYLYGEISQYGENFAGDFIQELNEIAGKCRLIKIRMNTPGGEVFEGLTIFQAIKGCKTPIEIYIDGMCASIGSVIAMAVPKERLFISRYGTIMTHRPSGCVSGNPDQITAYAKMMTDLEDILVSIYAERTGKTSADIKANWMKADTDTWFTSKDALTMGLVGGVFDGDVIELAESVQTKQQLWNFYNKISLTKQIEMKKIHAVMCSHFGIPETTTEDDVIAKFTALTNEHTQMSAKIVNLDKEIAAHTEREAQARKEAVKNMIDTAIDQRKFTAELRDSYTQMAELNFETTKKIIDGMPVVGKVINLINQGAASTDRKDWTWDDFHTKDSNALVEMKANNVTAYKALYKAKYGNEPVI
jgi:ATP-dependent protease ClpP protease subunit